ncbi:NAD(P)-dependent oxidoreductase [Paragemmobacter straminiformis]|uniref:Dihydrofolate reductase n=1 Tax=Paragemmobacter straminiformis TaxID=2045119 RepID=A0A842I664_9RHOB|nr:NAD(P)-dependent oxidoreductase [Gemmobacter straminiformis]MBC2835116.1 dihydrofolate reductase [Gemmobacter straminiformis]
MTATILVTCGHLQRHIGLYRDEIRAHGFDVNVPPLTGQQFGADDMANFLRDADVAIAGDDALGADVLEAGVSGRLRGLVRWGIGTDNVDKPTATRLGLPVFNTPGMFNHEVADLALGHLLNLSRHIHKMDRDVRQGKWTRFEGTSLNGKVSGIIGLGGIGREICRRVRAFGMQAIGCDVVTIPTSALEDVGATQVSFEDILDQADVIFLACALTAKNHHLLNATAFGRMKPGVLIINVARGPIIDETALIAALDSGRVAAAGLDVFEVEPLPAGSLLRCFDNCLFGTHSGSSTAEAIHRTNRASVDIALAMLGVKPDHLLSCNRIA